MYGDMTKIFSVHVPVIVYNPACRIVAIWMYNVSC